MPPWTQLSDIDIASVITYTRNSWSNKTGEAVQLPTSKRAQVALGRLALETSR
jgi:mono/diheme cytochrome c family protein